ncbi:hypothetical protein C8A03DRAFT_12343 [Achaetomium macrosporum]|uniref:Uncharacterized protein n=1 Tax=Achaetomium macrosporum TaxID=79813 RepID=A0AAN7CFX8_9PEZI|nr:hypothetical protein C8A03DRAFT_12343 [Achaetomium macrosporum]
MSYRSADAYSRRPTDDDRRGSDGRDRYRDSYSRARPSSHYPYRDDRYRRETRDTDAAPRERRIPPESPHDPPPPTPAKSDLATVSARPEQCSRESPVSRSPAASPSLDSDDACKKLVRLLKKQCEIEFELARLKRDREHLNDKLKQRQAEYEKSMVKHAEFPSVPEVQNMHRTRYAEQVRFLDAQITKAQEEAVKASCAALQAMRDLFSAQNRESDDKGAASAAFLQQAEKLKKQEAEITELKAKHRQLEERKEAEIKELRTKIRQLEERNSQDKSDLKAELSRRDAEMKGEMMMLKKAMSDEWKRELKEQLGLHRLEFEKQRADQKQSQQTDLRSQFSKHEEELRKAVEQQLLAHRSSSDTISTQEISTLIQKQSLTLQSDVSGLSIRVDELTGQLAQRTQDSVNLRNSLDTCTQQVEDQARKINDHEAQLSNIDFDVLDRVAEAISFDLPNLKRKVERIQSKVDDIPKEIDAKHDALYGKVEQYVGRIGTSLGQILDDTQRTVENHGARIKALEEGAASGGGRADIPQGHATELEFESINSDVAAIKTDYELTKAEVNRLAQEYSGLVDQINQANQSVKEASQSFQNQLQPIQLSIVSLDTRYNNLSTRALAEDILAHLAQVYPDAGQITADIGALKTLAESLDSRIESLEGRVEDFKESFEEKFEGSVSNGQERLYREYDECANHSVGHKRKRMGSEMNGVEHLLANGAG